MFFYTTDFSVSDLIEVIPSRVDEIEFALKKDVYHKTREPWGAICEIKTETIHSYEYLPKKMWADFTPDNRIAVMEAIYATKMHELLLWELQQHHIDFTYNLSMIETLSDGTEKRRKHYFSLFEGVMNSYRRIVEDGDNTLFPPNENAVSAKVILERVILPCNGAAHRGAFYDIMCSDDIKY